MKRLRLTLSAALALAALAACADTPLPTAAPAGTRLDLQPGQCVVTSTADSGAGTLREAISNVNCTHITFGVPGPITLTGAELLINRQLTIAGPEQGMVVRRDGTWGRILAIVSSGNVEISRLTISGGRSSSEGGAILTNGTLTLTHSSVSGNRSDFPGGGIFNNGFLVLHSTTVSGNGSDRVGGGILNNRNGTAIITNSTISGNTAPFGWGGGIFNRGDLTLLHTTVTGNTASGQGGGIENNGSRVVRLESSLVAGNTGNTRGQDLHNSGDNPAYAPTGTVIARFSLIGTDGFHSVADGTDGNRVGTQANPLDPMLRALADNGGLTRTHALLPGSPAIDAGSCTDHNGATVATDQRGVSRPQGHGCDMGAFERVQQAPSNPIEPLLGFLDAAVIEGTLVASGPVASAANRLGALRNMLTTAAALLAQGDLTGACGQLRQTYLRTDGEPQPPDFASGSAAAELAERILDVMEELGCP